MMEPKQGGLVTTNSVAVPLRGVSAEGELVGGVLSMRVRQRFENVEKTPIEAIYTFPLPSDAAVVGFVMESGGRRLEGMALEREEAFEKYDDALVSGHGAASRRRRAPCPSCGPRSACAISRRCPWKAGALRR